jgi:hypothetical protein
MSACSRISKDFKKSRLGEVLKVPGDGGAGVGYPHASLVRFFTEEQIEAIVNCSCESCPSYESSLSQPSKSDLVSKIMGKDNTGTYVSVLAFLLQNSECRFITRFIDKEYSDQKLSSLPILTELEFNELLGLEMGCNHTDYITFFQFFIPVLRYKDRSQAEPRTIHQFQTLPFNTIRQIGGGGYSKVFEAVMLEGHHNFGEVKVCP